MSPFLSLLVVESLNREIKEYQREGGLKGIKVHRSLSLYELLFFGDVILIGLGTMREVEK
jgi:hypothetical protein